MKRLFTVIICFLLFQIARANSSFIPPAFLSNQPVYHASYGDTIVVPVINQPAPLTYESRIFKRRLDSIKRDVPMDFNEYVQSYIDSYAHNREEMGRVLGLSKYYFPIYEKAFRDAGIPDEIKYLSVVESKLDPYAVSRVGATGPWQFMFTTARLYGLNMDDYVDDRRDPIQASYAAAAYLKDAYQEFGDWLLAIASYNCGKSNVEHAIERAGANDFWAIRQYLPVETRGYVPAFIAVAYLMNYYDRYNIVPQPCNFSLKTDTVVVNKYVYLSTISQALNVSLSELTILNPAYKRQIVNGTAKAPRRLVIPQVDNGKYKALYEALNKSTLIATPPQLMVATNRERGSEEMPSHHRVKRGETLNDIADTYGIELQDLKAWNHLHTNEVVPGQELNLKAPAGELREVQPAAHHQNYINYRVKRGDTLSGIAAKFDGASVEKIRSLNGLKNGRLQPGMMIRINRG